jgi:hypothetical protein
MICLYSAFTNKRCHILTLDSALDNKRWHILPFLKKKSTSKGVSIPNTEPSNNFKIKYSFMDL